MLRFFKLARALRVESLAGGCVGVYRMATILFADDARNIREFWKRELERDSHRVLLAGDGIEVKAAFQEAIPDLVILDIRMPGNGMASIEWITQHYPFLAVIVYTEDSTFQVNHPDLPIRACIFKSGDPTLLLNTIAKVLNKMDC